MHINTRIARYACDRYMSGKYHHLKVSCFTIELAPNRTSLIMFIRMIGTRRSWSQCRVGY